VELGFFCGMEGDNVVCLGGEYELPLLKGRFQGGAWVVLFVCSGFSLLLNLTSKDTHFIKTSTLLQFNNIKVPRIESS